MKREERESEKRDAADETRELAATPVGEFRGRRDALCPLHPFGRHFKRPRQQQRDRKTESHSRDEHLHHPRRRLEVGNKNRASLNKQPRHHGVGDGYLVDVAPLQLGEKVFRMHGATHSKLSCLLAGKSLQPAALRYSGIFIFLRNSRKRGCFSAVDRLQSKSAPVCRFQKIGFKSDCVERHFLLTNESRHRR